MDWIINIIKESWTSIMATGAVGGISVYAILNTLKSKKTLLNFEGLGHGFKELKKEFKGYMKVIFDKLTSFEIKLDKSEKENELLRQDNKLLLDLLVTTLTVVNVPLDQKKAFHTSLRKVANIADTAVEALKTNIDTLEQEKAVETERNNEIDNVIDELDIKIVGNI